MNCVMNAEGQVHTLKHNLKVDRVEYCRLVQEDQQLNYYGRPPAGCQTVPARQQFSLMARELLSKLGL